MLGDPRGGAGANGPPTAGLSERRSRPRGEADERVEAPGSKGGLGGRASVAAGRRVCVCRRSRVVCVCVWTGRQETASVGRAVRSSLTCSHSPSPRSRSPSAVVRAPLLHPAAGDAPSLHSTLPPLPQPWPPTPRIPRPRCGARSSRRTRTGRTMVCCFSRAGGGGQHRARSLNKHAARRAGGAYGRAGRCPTLQPGPGRLIGWLPLARWRAGTAPVGGRGARRKERRRAGGRDPRRSPPFLSSRPRRVSPPSFPSLPPSKFFQSSTPPSTASKRGWSCRRPASSTTPTLTPASASR
jgi:hypothetical protein